MRETVIVGAVRTPVGKRNGGLSDQHAADLSALVLNELAERTGVDPDVIDDVVWGCVSQVGDQSSNIGRYSVLAAGWPEHIPGTTVNRACGSSQQALDFAVQAVINFEDGAVALVAWMLGSPAPVPRFIVEGEKGGIRSEHAVHSQEKPKPGEGLDLYTVVGRRKRKTTRVPFAKVDWSAFYKNVGAALAGRAPLVVRPEEALRHVAVNEAAYRSAKTGRAERLR